MTISEQQRRREKMWNVWRGFRAGSALAVVAALFYLFLRSAEMLFGWVGIVVLMVVFIALVTYDHAS